MTKNNLIPFDSTVVYQLTHPSYPWKGWGKILFTGMVQHLPRLNGMLQLERTGPYVPPIANSGIGNLIVTDAFRTRLLDSGLTGCSFVPVVKSRIVEFRWWEDWDQSSEDPPEYPRDNEAVNWLLDRPHSEKLANELGALWEVQLQESASVRNTKIGKGLLDYRLEIIEHSQGTLDWFLADSMALILISNRAKHWLESQSDIKVAFQKLDVIAR